MKTAPLSKFQEQFWFLNMLAPQSAAYNIPAVFKFGKLPDIGLLEKTLNTIISRHEILRTHYSMQETRLIQVINPPEQVYVPIALTKFDEVVESEIPEVINCEINRPFDLSKAPLLRSKIFQYNNAAFLCIVFHHIAIDVHSKIIFENEFSTIFNSFLNKKNPQLEPVDKQYIDYSLWQNEWFKSDKASDMINLWLGELPSSNTFIKLPCDKPRPAFSKLNGKRELFEMPSPLTTKIKLYASKKTVNTFAVLLSCYSIFLHKITQQNTIVIGVPLSNRKQDDFKYTFGPFVNAIPIYLDFSETQNFDDVLSQVKQKMLFAHRKQEVPFLTIVNTNKENRSPSYNPYYQTGFTFEPRMVFNLDGYPSTPVPIERDGAQLDLFLTMWEQDQSFKMFWEYSTDLFERSTVLKFHEFFITVVDYFVSGNFALEDINYLLQQKKIVTAETPVLNINNYRQIPVETRFVHELFEKQVTISGNKIAVVCNDEALTYASLDSMANKIANYLIKKGVRGNDIVGISLNRSAQMLACVLAILKTGAAYLPLDPSFPADRLSYMLNDSKAKLLLTEAKLETNIKANVEKIILENILAEFNHLPESLPEIQVTTESMAYLMYTSGSTGMPKGVKVHHGAVTNFIESMANVPGFTADDILLAVTTLSFDISVLELFLPLYKGGTVVIAQKSEVINGSALMKLMDQYSVSFLQATPVTWNILIHSGWEGNPKLKALCGGEAISISLIKELLPRVGELWNMYGPTETTVWSTCGQIKNDNPPVLVGRPINNTSIYICSENNITLPIGSTGEVCIGGLGVSKGYHNQSGLTNEKFIPLNNGELIYKTGDLGKIHESGQIELFGRIDNQIKLRGFRIEPGEIEVQICKIEGVREAVVKVQKITDHDERLVAFLNVTEAFKSSSDYIIQSLKSGLPDYMIPLHYKILNDFPRTPNGKIDKKKLVLQNSEIHSDSGNIDINLTEGDLEKDILTIWKNTLKKNDINLNDNFFDIGGNSILVLQMAMTINKYLGKELNILSYFEYPTIKSFISLIANNGEEKSLNNGPSNRHKHFQRLGERRRLQQ